jgi:hypothetical protein
MDEPDWSYPLDVFTLQFLVSQLTNDREGYVRMAREVKPLDEEAGEAFLIRAEECARFIHQLRRLLEKSKSTPPPSPEESNVVYRESFRK